MRMNRVFVPFCIVASVLCTAHAFFAEGISRVLADGSPVSTDSNREIEVDSLLTPDTSGKYREVVSKALAGANAVDLTRLKRHPNWGVALQAAWTEWIDDRRRLSGKYDATRVREGANRWIGFLEGRLGIKPPDAWCDCVKTARPMREGATLETDPQRMDPLFFELKADERAKRIEVLPGLFALAGITAVRQKSIVRFRSGKEEIATVDLQEIEAAPINDDGNFGDAAVDWHSETDPKLLVLRRLWLDRYYITTIPSISTQKGWSAEVGGGHAVGARCFNVPDHSVYLESTKNEVFVFGCCNCCVYLEGFNAETGKKLGRFSSALW